MKIMMNNHHQEAKQKKNHHHHPMMLNFDETDTSRPELTNNMLDEDDTTTTKITDHHNEARPPPTPPPSSSSTIYFELYNLGVAIDRPLIVANNNNTKATINSRRRRLWYTCSDVHPIRSAVLIAAGDERSSSSSSILAMGTTSGSVYLFQKMAMTLSQPNNNNNNNNNVDWQHSLTIIANDIMGLVTTVHLFEMMVFADDHPDPDPFQISSSKQLFDSNEHADPDLIHLDRQSSSSCTALMLAIGTSKGHLMIVRILLNHTTTTTTANNNNNDPLPPPVIAGYKIVYHCKTITNQEINMIRFDYLDRLFLTDSFGRIFVLCNLHDVLTENTSTTNAPQAPTILINLNGSGVFQFDVCPDFFLFSTQENRVYFFDLTEADCFQISANQTKSRRNQHYHPGVCIVPAVGQRWSNNHHIDDQHDDDDVDDLDDLYDDFDGQPSNHHRSKQLDFRSFVTRPKCRLWEVDSGGRIQYTHQFFHLVNSHTVAPPSQTRVVAGHSPDDIFATDGDGDGHDHDQDDRTIFNSFEQLCPMYHPQSGEEEEEDGGGSGSGSGCFLVTFANGHHPTRGSRSRIFVINVEQQTLVATTPILLGRIVQIKCLMDEIYVTYYTDNIGDAIQKDDDDHYHNHTHHHQKQHLRMVILTLHMPEMERCSRSASSSSSSLRTVSPCSLPAAPSSGFSSSDPCLLNETQEFSGVDDQTTEPDEPNDDHDDHHDHGPGHHHDIAPEPDTDPRLLLLYSNLTTIHQPPDVGQDDFRFQFVPIMCQCGLPLPGSIQMEHLKSVDNPEHGLFFHTINLLTEQQLRQLKMIARERKDWRLYFNLITYEKTTTPTATPTLEYLFYASMLDDHDWILLRSKSSPPATGAIGAPDHSNQLTETEEAWSKLVELWRQVLVEEDEGEEGRINFDSGLVLPPTIDRNRSSQPEQRSCLRCMLKRQFNSTSATTTDNDQPDDQSTISTTTTSGSGSSLVRRFFQNSILLPSLWYCRVDFVWQHLLPTILRMLPERYVDGQSFSIDFYLLILRFKTMELSIAPRSRWLLDRLDTKLSTLRSGEGPPGGQQNDDTQDRLDWLIERTVRRRSLTEKSDDDDDDDPNGPIRSRSRRSGRFGMILDLSKTNCDQCGEGLLQTKKKKNHLGGDDHGHGDGGRSGHGDHGSGGGGGGTKIKLYHECGHVFHSKCLNYDNLNLNNYDGPSWSSSSGSSSGPCVICAKAKIY